MKKRITLSMLVFFIIVSMSSLSLTQNVYAVNTAATGMNVIHMENEEGNKIFARAGASGNPIDDFLSVANAQKGKKAADYGFTDNWCAWFVCWCGRSAGLYSKGYFPNSFGTVTDLCNWFVDNNKGVLYYADPGEVHVSKNANGISKSSFIPQKGDLICFLWNPNDKNRRYDHVGIVSGYSNGTVYYIDGNTGGTGSWRTNYVKTDHSTSRTSPYITAYLRPNYGGFSADNLPIGRVDAISGLEKSIFIDGWAFDEDVPSKQLEIHIYVGGPAGSPNASGYRIIANKERRDVNAVYGKGIYHGFNETISVDKTGTQEVYVYAINANSGNHKLLGSYSIYIKRENKINFPTRTITLNEGETKTISFTFQGDGIYTLSLERSNGNVSTSWGKVDWAVPKANFSITGLKAGTTSLNVWFQDSNGKNYFKDTVTVKVNHVHKYTTAKVTKKPTCTLVGTRSYVCSCGAVSTATESIPAVGHTVVADSAVAATCTTNGKTAGKHCSVCKTVIVQQETIAATGHKGGTATCTSKAKCSTCGASYGNYGNHQYSTDWTIDKAASCATAGSKSFHCKYCDAKKDITSIPATGHSWDKGTVLRQATETTTGLKSYTCYNCGATKTETLPTIEKEEDDIILVRKITLSQTNAELSCGDTLQLTPTIAPANADNKAVVWTSSDESIITVSSTGLVKAVSPGSAMIFCTAIDGSGVRGSCSITVLSKDVSDVPMPPSEPDDSEDDDEEDYENEELEEGDMLTDPKSDADYEIIELQNGMGTVKYLGSNANAKTIKIPETVTVYGVTYKVTSIGEGAFEDDRNVTRIIMGNNITNIERNAFKGCSELTSIIIGNNVTQIGDKAFYKCKKLTKITIPSKVNKIGKQAFYGCKKLKRITIKTTKLTGKRIGSKAFKGIYERAMVKVPKSKLKIYQKILKEKGIGAKAKIRK